MPKLAPGGSSDEGSSALKALLLCPQLYAYRRYAWGFNGHADSERAASLGSAVHTILAQHYLRVRARQRGDDPDDWYAPAVAISEAMIAGQLGQLSPEMQAKAWDIYTTSWTENAKGPIIEDVEVKLGIEFDYQACGEWRVGRYTPRTDLVTKGLGRFSNPEDRDKFFIWDHKTGYEIKASSIAAYTVDWQFILSHAIGRATWGDQFGGVILQAITTTPPYRVDVHRIPASPFLLARVERRLAEAYSLRDTLEAETARGERTAYEWPAALNEIACQRRYGRCDGYDLCFRGPVTKRS